MLLLIQDNNKKKEAIISRSLVSFVLSLSCLVGFSVYGGNQLFASLTQSGSTTKENFQLPSSSGISLVTSFWAENEHDEDKIHQLNSHTHRREIEAAMLVNLQNPYLRQVVVILDSVSDNTTDCPGFVNYMTRKLDNITQSSSIFASETTSNNRRLPQLECIERRGSSSGQPTYFEMFHYATYHPSITSDIVIVSNADQVFDETLYHAKNMSNNTIFVLATRGYPPDKVPPRIREQYRAWVGHENGTATNSWCNETSAGGGEMKPSWSWDAFIFNRFLLRETLPIDDHDNGDFTRLNFQRVPSVYYMNEFGAEYAALHDITRGLLGKVTVWNACHLIQTWHFHLTAKMHHTMHAKARWPYMAKMFGGGNVFYEDFGPVIPRDGKSMESNDTIPNRPSSRVPTPSVLAPFCTDSTSCHSENPLSKAAFHNWPQRDASNILRGPTKS